MQFVGRVGEGDLTQQAKISSADELGELASRLDQMVAGLKDVAGQTRFATENLNSASAEILASTQQQAASTGEQAAAIQQTTTTMEEVTQSGAQISERAKQVAASAEATSAASHAGLQAVENTSRTMEAIREQAEAVAENVVSLSEKTQAIGEIISTVNDHCRAVSPAGAERGHRGGRRRRTWAQLLRNRERSEESGGSVAGSDRAGAVDSRRHSEGHQQLGDADRGSRQTGGIGQAAGRRGRPDHSRR